MHLSVGRKRNLTANGQQQSQVTCHRISATTGATINANPSQQQHSYRNIGVCPEQKILRLLASLLQSVFVCINETTLGANDGSSASTPSGGTTPYFTYGQIFNNPKYKRTFSRNIFGYCYCLPAARLFLQQCCSGVSPYQLPAGNILKKLY